MRRIKLKSICRKARDIYCHIDFWMDRGQVMLEPFIEVVKYTAYATMVITGWNSAFGKYGWEIAFENVFFLVPPLAIVLTLLGYLDVKKVHTLQKTNELSTKYNPYLVKLILNRGRGKIKNKKKYAKIN